METKIVVKVWCRVSKQRTNSTELEQLTLMEKKGFTGLRSSEITPGGNMGTASVGTDSVLEISDEAVTAEEPMVIECSIEKAWNILGNKWAFFVLRELYEGPRRFSQLQRAMHGISPKSLTDTLRHLERYGVVNRQVFPTVPVTVEYSVTHKGEAFHVVIKEMKRWGAQWG